MDILEKLDRLLADTTCHAAGSVDMSQGPYGGNVMGYRRKKKKRGETDNITEIIGKFIKGRKPREVKNIYALSPEERREREKRHREYKQKRMARQHSMGEANKPVYNKDFGVYMHGAGAAAHKASVRKQSKSNPKMEMIDAIRDFIMDQRTWFEFDDAGDDYIYLTTRENGDVGNETPGQADWREGQRLGKAIKQNFKNVKISLDYIDEWVNLEVRI